MVEGDESGEPELAAGDFSPWLARMRGALRGENPSDVPCGTCTACCRASKFVHIAPDETDTLAHVPPTLLFPATRPKGHLLLGYDEHGHCPMLVDDRCSIYEHRPRTCRTYDCRVFAAAGGGMAGESDDIARQARRWRFSFPTETDHVEHRAVRAAMSFLARKCDEPAAAVLALEIHDVFLGGDDPDLDIVEMALHRAAGEIDPD